MENSKEGNTKNATIKITEVIINMSVVEQNNNMKIAFLCRGGNVVC
jgi:hypothetical protein